MKNFISLALGIFSIVLSCSSYGAEDNQTPANSARLTQLVVFGDSLSDVGTYKVGSVAALGGGRWTVNSSTAKNWTEELASAYGLQLPCAAQTGLHSIIPGFMGAPVTNFSNCRNYAQGSSRVSSPFGPRSYAVQQAVYATSGPASAVSIAGLGLMADPITKQMTAHLNNANGAYSGTELVTILVGADDIFMNLNAISSASGNSGATAIAAAEFADWINLPDWNNIKEALQHPGPKTALTTAMPAAQSYMIQIANTLAKSIKLQVLAKGAKHVVVLNVPDISTTPFIRSQNSSDLTKLAMQLTAVYNTTLQTALLDTGVIFVDTFTELQKQVANPQQYGLSNITTPACSTSSPNNPLHGLSLTCTNKSTLSGIDTSTYLFADSVHPTPYGYSLLTKFVLEKLKAANLKP